MVVGLGELYNVHFIEGIQLKKPASNVTEFTYNVLYLKYDEAQMLYAFTT